jgi:hypothetical protein
MAVLCLLGGPPGQIASLAMSETRAADTQAGPCAMDQAATSRAVGDDERTGGSPSAAAAGFARALFGAALPAAGTFALIPFTPVPSAPLKKRASGAAGRSPPRHSFVFVKTPVP